MKNSKRVVIHGTLHDVYDYTKMIELDAKQECSSQSVLPQNEKSKQKVYTKKINPKGFMRGK